MPRNQNGRGGRPNNNSRGQNQNQNQQNGGSNKQHRKNADRMTIECNTCGQEGHMARKCPQGRQNNNHNNSQNGQRNHTNGNNNNQQQQQQNQPQGPPTCTFCSKPSHHANDCFHNPQSAKYRGVNFKATGNAQNKNGGNGNGNGNAQQNNNHNSKPAGFPMNGFVFDGAIPTYNGTDPYCPTCNNRTHFQSHCPNQQAVYTLLCSKFTCWKCGSRGHTGDECQHPSPQTQKCGVCHHAGHSAEACRNELQKKLVAASRGAESRFRWNGNIQKNDGQLAEDKLHAELERLYAMGQMLTPEREVELRRAVAERQQLVFPGSAPFAPFVRPGPVGRPATFRSHQNEPVIHAVARPIHNLTPNDIVAQQQRLADIRAKINRSAGLYIHQNYNLIIQRNANIIQAKDILPNPVYWEVSKRMAWGYQFYRDPRAVEAVVRNQKACCLTCKRQGVFLDGQMRGIADRDILTIRDGDEWGVFVMFECSCSKEGWSYVKGR